MSGVWRGRRGYPAPLGNMPGDTCHPRRKNPRNKRPLQSWEEATSTQLKWSVLGHHQQRILRHGWRKEWGSQPSQINQIIHLRNNTEAHISFDLCQALCIISKPWVNSNWSYSPQTLNSGQNRQFFVPYDLEVWQVTLKNNRAPLLCCFKLCASFHGHWWIKICHNFSFLCGLSFSSKRISFTLK